MDRFLSILSALANVGLLLVGLAALWTTLRVSGLEDYFRSELALRNSELVAAERRLSEVQVEVQGALKEVSDAQERLEELRNENHTLLREKNLIENELVDLKENADVLSSAVERLEGRLSVSNEAMVDLQKEVARRDFQERLTNAFAHTIIRLDANDPRLPIGSDMFHRFMQSYESAPPPNRIAELLVSQFPGRCYGDVAAPLVIGERTTVDPLARWTRDGAVQGTGDARSSAQQDENTRNQSLESVEEVRRKVRETLAIAHEEGEMRRSKVEEETQRVLTSLETCGLTLIEELN